MDALTTPLPKDWQKVRLGDILELLTDYHANGSYEILKNNVTLLKNIDFAIMIRTTNFENNDFKNDLIYIDKKAYEFLSKSKVFAGDILVNKIANAGTAYFMPKLNQPVSLGMNLFLLRIKPSYNNLFIFKQIANCERVLKTFANGSATKTITKNVIKNLLIPLPPLNEQAAIANILSDLDRYLYSLDALILKKESVKKALRIKMLNQILASNGIEFRELGDIILSLKTGLNPRSFFKLNTPNANNYYVTIRELEDYTIKFTHQTDRIDDNALSLCLKRSNLEKDDILFSGTGTIGKVSIIEKNPNNWAIKEGIYSIKPNKKIVFPRFLMFCLESSNIQNDIKNKSFGGIVKSIPMNDLQQIQIPLPPLNKQIAIANILSGLDHEIISLKNKKRQFENIKKALNHDLMSAKIRVLNK
ncbi:restriction endonuclease subunit S [Helicobacter pylori]|uniref:restriction endonuclease subunit S n=1 Tax=Helicobacter pylori TaxID=210 RepID=UPI0013F44371|nr:restriction endonuclease subunit S [Helicobacter pylori]